MRLSAIAWLLWSVTALVGCRDKNAFARQCDLSTEALGVPLAEMVVPADQAGRDTQLALVTTAVDGWAAAKDSVSLAEVRVYADPAAKAVIERKALLAGTTFQERKLDAPPQVLDAGAVLPSHSVPPTQAKALENNTGEVGQTVTALRLACRHNR
jgi:hypothetical protein